MTTKHYQIYERLKKFPHWHSAEQLGDMYNLDKRLVRKIVSEINRSYGCATFDYVIISGNQGYKVAETYDEAMTQLKERLEKPALMMLDRYHKAVKKLKHDHQQKLKVFPYMKNEFNSVQHKEVEKMRDDWEEQKTRF